MMHDDQLKCHPRGSPPLCANTAANDDGGLFLFLVSSELILANWTRLYFVLYFV